MIGYYYTPTKMTITKQTDIANTGKHVEILKLSYINGGNVKQSVWQFLKMLNIYLPHNSVFQLLGIYIR